MPVLTQAERSERSRQAAIKRHHPDDPAAADESLRRLRSLRAESYLRELISTPRVPDLSDRRRLANILLGRGGDRDAAA
jgi:hypothetical protein